MRQRLYHSTRQYKEEGRNRICSRNGVTNYERLSSFPGIRSKLNRIWVTQGTVDFLLKSTMLSQIRFCRIFLEPLSNIKFRICRLFVRSIHPMLVMLCKLWYGIETTNRFRMHTAYLATIQYENFQLQWLDRPGEQQTGSRRLWFTVINEPSPPELWQSCLTHFLRMLVLPKFGAWAHPLSFTH